MFIAYHLSLISLVFVFNEHKVGILERQTLRLPRPPVKSTQSYNGDMACTIFGICFGLGRTCVSLIKYIKLRDGRTSRWTGRHLSSISWAVQI